MRSSFLTAAALMFLMTQQSCTPSGTTQEKADTVTHNHSTETASENKKGVRRYSVMIPEDRQDRKIHVKDNEGKISFFRELDDVPYYDHYHFAEYYPDDLFIIIRKSPGADELQDELWHYTRNGKWLIVTSRGIDFRVHPEKQYIAYTTGEESDLFIYDLQNNRLKKSVKVIGDSTSGSDIHFLSWSATSPVIWGYIAMTDDIDNFFSCNADKSVLTAYEVPPGLQSDYDLNPDKGLLIYSDSPQFYDVEGEEEFKRSGQKLTLFLYDFTSGKQKYIATSRGKRFDPQWVNSDTCAYNDPSSGERVKISWNR